MSKGRINLSHIEPPKIKTDGTAVEITFVAGNSQKTTIAVSAEALGVLISQLIALDGATKLRGEFSQADKPEKPSFEVIPPTLHVLGLRLMVWESESVALQLQTVEQGEVHLFLGSVQAKSLLAAMKKSYMNDSGHFVQ